VRNITGIADVYEADAEARRAALEILKK